MTKVESLKEKLDSLKDRPWTPLDVGMLNNHKIRLGFFKREYGWHKHDDADEFFLVLKGKIVIKLKNENVVLRQGEYMLLPKGTVHNLISDEDSYVMVVQPITMKTTRVPAP